MTRRALLVVGVAAAISACASSPVARFVHVTPLPQVTPLAGQTARDQQWDVRDCQAEAGSRTDYNPADSPFANALRRVFFWGASGAAVGGTIEGSFPTVVGSSSSEASTGVIAGGATGGAVGAATSWAGASPYERAWAACMAARGYRIVPPDANPDPPTRRP